MNYWVHKNPSKTNNGAVHIVEDSERAYRNHPLNLSLYNLISVLVPESLFQPGSQKSRFYIRGFTVLEAV